MLYCERRCSGFWFCSGFWVCDFLCETSQKIFPKFLLHTMDINTYMWKVKRNASCAFNREETFYCIIIQLMQQIFSQPTKFKIHPMCFSRFPMWPWLKKKLSNHICLIYIKTVVVNVVANNKCEFDNISAVVFFLALCVVDAMLKYSLDFSLIYLINPERKQSIMKTHR